MRSSSTFAEEMENIGDLPGVLHTSEEAEKNRPPVWITTEFGFHEIPVAAQDDAESLLPANRAPLDSGMEPDDDWPHVPGYGGLVMPVSTDWIGKTGSASPDEFVGERVGVDVEAAVGVLVADPDLVRQRIASATANHGTDAFATYLPWHKYANSQTTPWGMWFFLEPLLWWATHLYLEAQTYGIPLGPVDAFNLAFLVAYRHEQFHFHVERFATRQEVLLRRPVYLPYDEKVFSDPKVVGTKHWLEEALAQAVVLESRWLHRRIRLPRRQIREFLRRQFKRFGGGYKDFECKSKGGTRRAHGLLGAQIMRAVRRPRIPVTEMAKPKREYRTAPEEVPGYLTFMPHVVSRFQIAMPKYRAWRNWARHNGAHYQGSGPGDHEVWIVNGHRVHINRRGKECDFASMKAVAKARGVSLRKLIDEVRSA